ncbi:MAG: hypothetical protein PUA96_09645 [Bacteroidales bacterium]|nr:hypothetical protein [Bacteroidales bacterium]
MNQFRLSIFAVIMALLTASCASQSMPQKLNDFVDKAELKSSSYSESDWAESAAEYQQLVDDYINSGKEYNEEEKKMAARAMGRYHALLIKNGLEKGASFLKIFGNMLPEYLDGFSSGLDDNADSLGSTLDNLFDEEKIERSLDALENTLEKIFGNEIE